MANPSKRESLGSPNDQDYEISDSGLNQRIDALNSNITGKVENVSFATDSLENAIVKQNSEATKLNEKMIETLKSHSLKLNQTTYETSGKLSKAICDLKILFMIFSGTLTASELGFAYWLFKFPFPIVTIYYLIAIFILQEVALYIVYKWEEDYLIKVKSTISNELNTAEKEILEKISEKFDLHDTVATSRERSGRLRLLLGNVLDVTKELFPNLKKVVAIYELRQKKDIIITKVRYSLTRYNFNFDDVLERLLRPYIITGDNEDSWLKQITNRIGKSIKLGENVIGVIICDSGFFQNNLSQFWDSMTDVEFKGLSSILVNQNVIVSKKIKDDKTLTKLVELSLKSSKDTYSLNRIQKRIIEIENEFETFFEQISEISSLFHIDDIPSREELLNYTPKDLSNLFDELYSLTSEKSKVERDILLLFRASVTSPNHGKLQRAKVSKLCDLSKLSKFIEKRPEISFKLDSKSIEKILENPDWVDFFELKGFFKRFYETKEVISNFSKFLYEQKLKTRTVEFSDIVHLLPTNFEAINAETFEEVGIALIDEKENSFGIEKSSINLAALSLFIYEKAPFRNELFQIYKRAASDVKASKILYCRARMMDDSETKEAPISLYDAIIEAQSFNELESHSYLPDYQTMLKSNHVYSSIKIMVEGRFRDFSRLIMENSWSKYYSKLETHIKTFFNAKIVRESVPSLLKYNLVRAYLITSPSKFALMKLLESKNFPIVLNALEGSDSDYGELRRIKGGTGNSTRVLVISSKVSFEKFRSMLDGAIKRFLESFPDEVDDLHRKYSFAYVMRLYSSKESMGVIPRQRTDINSLHNLILESMEDLLPTEQMSIVAAATSEGSVELTLNAINLEMLNQNSVDIFEFIDREPFQNDIANLLDSKVKDRVQKEILGEFGVSGIGDLCKYLFKLKSDLKIESRFLNAVERGTKHFISEKKKLLKEISLNLFEELNAIGGMLTPIDNRIM